MLQSGSRQPEGVRKDRRALRQRLPGHRRQSATVHAHEAAANPRHAVPRWQMEGQGQGEVRRRCSFLSPQSRKGRNKEIADDEVFIFSFPQTPHHSRILTCFV